MLDSRYILRDKELSKKVKEYNDLDVFSKLTKTTHEVLVPRLNSLEKLLRQISKENKNIKIPRRMDGQYKGKTSFGQIFSDYASRLNARIKDVKNLSLDFSKLKEARRNDKISDLFYFSISALSVEANIADDMRHHFRSEIEEVSYDIGLPEFEYRVGSSTMPHKINPWEFERVKSFWKTYSPKIHSAVMSQVVEHQGDSTNQDFPYNTYELSLAVSYITKHLDDTLRKCKFKKTIILEKELFK